MNIRPMTAAELTAHALALELALYRQRIEPVCPLGLTADADRWHTERQAVIEARRAAESEGNGYFATAGEFDAAAIRQESEGGNTSFHTARVAPEKQSHQLPAASVFGAMKGDSCR